MIERDDVSGAPRYQPLVVVAAALMSGIALDRWAELSLGWIVATCLMSQLGWAVLRSRGQDRTACVYLLLAVACLGGAWHHLRWRYFDGNDIATFAREEYAPVVLEAVAREAPRRVAAPPFDPMNAIPRGERTRLELDVVAIRDDDAWRDVTGRALLTVDGVLTEIEAGDRVRVVGAFATPAPPLNPGGFNYADFLRAERIRTTVFAERPAAVTRIAPAPRFSLRRWLGRVRVTGEEDLQHQLSPRSARLAASLLLNAREQMEQTRTEAFLETGTIHHLAISGTHVGVLAAALFLVLRLGLLPRGMALGLIVAVVTFYGAVTGGDAPVLRSVVLVAIVCLAIQLGRQPLGFNSLGAAAIGVLIWNPAELFDVGAQLSFISVAVLIHVARHWIERAPTDPLERLIAETRPWPIRALRWIGRSLWRITAISIAVWLVTMPLIMARFHLVSPVSVVLNPLVWAPVAVALLSGFATLLVGWVPLLGAATGWVCDRSLALTEASVTTLNQLPGGHTYVPGPSEWWLAGFYTGCVAIALFPSLFTWRRRAALLSGWIIVGVGASLWTNRAEPELRCQFLSMGHGCAVLVELPDGRRLLYDAGQLGLPSAAARTIAETLWRHGVTHVDAVVISHADVDHYCALPQLMERFSIGAVYVGPKMFRPDAPDAVRALERSLREQGLTATVAQAGDELKAGDGVRIEVLHPPSTGVDGSDNANSVALAIAYAGRRILLTGDLEPPGLEALLNGAPLDCDVLMAPHHGSGGSDPPGTVPLNPHGLTAPTAALPLGHEREPF